MPFAMPQPGEKWKYIPESKATPDTPIWMIKRANTKSAVWEWQGKQRIIQGGKCPPFDSVSELFALVEHLENNPDFKLVYGQHQTPVGIKNLTELQNGGVKISFSYLPGEPPASYLHKDVQTLDELWVVQLPWEPIPRQYRTWLQPARGPAETKFWAGGFLWNGDESKLEEFKSNNYWRLGYAEDDEKASGKAAWRYYHQIEIGDEFAIKGYGGTNDVAIHYIGRVTGKDTANGGLHLEHLPNRVLARGKKPGGKGTGNWFNTLVPVTAPDVIRWVFHHDESDLPPPKDKPMNDTLNTILYGPPGTGKTFRTSQNAVEIVESSVPEGRKALMVRYSELQKNGRISFVTFHQSYSYEDFIEGLRPVLDTESESQIATYEVRSGVLKDCATDAFFALLQPIASRSKQNLPSKVRFDDLWNAFLNHVDNERKQEYEVNPHSRYQIIRAKRGGVNGINVATGMIKWSYACGKPIGKLVWDALGERNNVTPQDVESVIKVGAHYSFITAVLHELQRLEKILTVTPNLPQKPLVLSVIDREERVLDYLTSGEDSGYRINPDRESWPRYVLIIDEINRGNISKILGELITLLEDDKRIGEPNELIVTLPYSREKFGLPPNLHIIGTMNTADKSIALVDLALRRRFEFEELRPDFSASVCTGLSDEMRTALVGLNQRISLRKDRDHRIGHAYFINVNDTASFNRVFERKIVPLLGEYFHGDWEGLRWVLDKQNESTGFVRKIPGSGDRASRNHWQWYLDADDAATFDPLATLVANFKATVAGNSTG